MFCSTCNAEVSHDPIPEDEAHCGCVSMTEIGGHLFPTRKVYGLDVCACPCHGPTWLTEGDADVPDMIEEPSIYD